VTIEIYKEQLGLGNISPEKEYFRKLFEAVAGYGLGASLVALVTRLGGGMFEGATEAGSELIGRVEGALPLNHSRNAATVALHAGHNIEGIVAANSDLVGSYSELACVAFLLSSTSLVGWIA
jgi:Na+/H+-translocating membrane pyrophosphatase